MAFADVPAPGTPQWWLADLSRELDARQQRILLFEDYYEGRHNLKFATRKFLEAFGGMFREFSDNWTEVVVDAAVERLAIQGFRFESGDETGDAVAWEIWQRNFLDCDSEIAHTQAFVAGEAAIIVGPPENGETVPLITVEHPSQVVVRRDSGTRRRRLAALKRWFDEGSQRLMATVYLPDATYKFQSQQTYKDGSFIPTDVQWAERGGVPVRAPNPVGVVPVVPLMNKETLISGGHSEIEQVIPMQDLVNKLLTDMTIASEFTAFKQRVLIGVEVPRDSDGNPIAQDLIASASRTWMLEQADAKVQELGGSDLSPYVNAIKMARDHIAARTRTPPHYLLGEIVNASGDALKAAEAGLVNKVYRRQRFFGESWEEVMRLAFAFQGDQARATAYAAETIWQDPETVTDAQMMDALAKMHALGVPQEAIWARMKDVTPTQIERWKSMIVEQNARTLPTPDPEATAEGALIRSSKNV